MHPVSTIDADLDTQQMEVVSESATVDPEPQPAEAPAASPAAARADLESEPVELLPPPSGESFTAAIPPTPPSGESLDHDDRAAPFIVAAEDMTASSETPTTELPTSSGPSITEMTATADTPTTEMSATGMSATGMSATADTATTAMPLPARVPITEEMPAIFDGQDDLVEYRTPREPFRLRLIFLFSLFAAAAMVMSIVADLVAIRTSRPTSGIVTGTSTLDDLGDNLGFAGFVGVAVMVIGALLTCFGLRWGAGLAGGAGLALIGWAGLVIGLAELPIAIAESVTRTSSESFTLSVTRDLGWWLVAGVGVIALLVFLASLRSIGRGGRAALNPLVAAITAVAMVILAAGPLIAVGNATFADNFRSVDPERDLPTVFLAGRLGQVALIAFAGVVGMLIVRSFGVGLAVGGVSVASWLWLSSFIELGANPVGIAYANPGAPDTVPHAVTTTGMAATLALLVIAAAFATFRLTRTPKR